MTEGEEDLFGEEDFEGSEEAKELPNVIPKCHKTPRVSDVPYRIAWKAELQTFLTYPDDQIKRPSRKRLRRTVVSCST